MSVSHTPNGFTSVTPYFIAADAEAFVKFIKRAFDAEVVDEHFDNDILRHGAYKIFDSMIEASHSRGQVLPNYISIHLYVPDCDAVFAKAIAAGGRPISDVSDQPYGERSGGVEDPCGNSWWIATQQIDMYPGNK